MGLNNWRWRRKTSLHSWISAGIPERERGYDYPGWVFLTYLCCSFLYCLDWYGVAYAGFSSVSYHDGRITKKKFSALLGYRSEFESLGIYRFPSSFAL